MHPPKKLTISELSQRALDIRRMIIRMVHAASCGHPGGPLGLADIFAVLYFDIMEYKAKEALWLDRDRLILSNGHVSAVRYAAMKLAGYFPEVDLLSFRKFSSPLQGHPSTRYLPELEHSGGSLGQGLSVATALALGCRMRGLKGQVFVSLSDGECGEGMTWEAATAAVHYGSPLIAFVDNNGIQIDGRTKDVCDLGELSKKFASFGWKTCEVDGHDISAIRQVFCEAKEELAPARKKIQKNSAGEKAQPWLILFHTILGKSVSYMENNHKWHGTAPNDEEALQALRELGEEAL